MKVFTLASWMLMMAAPLPAGAETATQGAEPSMRARLSRDAIRNAVRETLAEAPAPRKDAGPVLRGERYGAFERQVDEARVPACWHPDAMKHQPPKIGPIALGGIFALPFLAAAVARGKCNP
jgi:hypothetical protein